MAPKTCGAKTRGGKTCKRAPMANGRCNLHGGKTPSGPASPHFIHGKYAYVFRDQLAEKFQAVEQQDPLDLIPELSVVRTLLAQLLQNMAADRLYPAQLDTVAKLISEITKTTSAIVKNRNDTALTKAEIVFIQTRMIGLMEKYVPDPERRTAFIAELRGLIPERNDGTRSETQELAISADASSETV